jgi:hypothetical protein
MSWARILSAPGLGWIDSGAGVVCAGKSGGEMRDRRGAYPALFNRRCTDDSDERLSQWVPDLALRANPGRGGCAGGLADVKKR